MTVAIRRFPWLRSNRQRGHGGETVGLHDAYRREVKLMRYYGPDVNFNPFNGIKDVPGMKASRRLGLPVCVSRTASP